MAHPEILELDSPFQWIPSVVSSTNSLSTARLSDLLWECRLSMIESHATLNNNSEFLLRVAWLVKFSTTALPCFLALNPLDKTTMDPSSWVTLLLTLTEKPSPSRRTCFPLWKKGRREIQSTFVLFANAIPTESRISLSCSPAETASNTRRKTEVNPTQTITKCTMVLRHNIIADLTTKCMITDNKDHHHRVNNGADHLLRHTWRIPISTDLVIGSKHVEREDTGNPNKC
mmetsp:Transcript_43841/g.105780  ORF Transcript_43841/g.105780 Transcript_43841/m.105780 type:complete len:230 (+) Transcript_43841:924-1613(+)